MTFSPSIRASATPWTPTAARYRWQSNERRWTDQQGSRLRNNLRRWRVGHAALDGAGAVPAGDLGGVGRCRAEANTGSSPFQASAISLTNLTPPAPPPRVSGGVQL